MFTFGLAGGGREFDPLVLLLIALVIEAYLGEMRFLYKRRHHPLRLIAGLVATLDRKLNREHRGQADRAVRGLLAVLFVAGVCAGVGWAVAWLTRNHAFGWFVELPLLVTLMAQRGVYDRVRGVADALTEHGVDQARQELSPLVGRDPSRLDAHGVARAAIESCARNYSVAVVAPVFWYVLFGFPGLLVYKAVTTMDAMIGHRTPRYRAFGLTAARLDDVLGLIPARLAGLLVVLATLFVPAARPGGALKVMLRDAGKHRSFNAGWPAGAMAGALHLTLAGPRHYAEGTVNDPWIGDGRATATAEDIRRGLHLYAVACLLNLMIVAAVAVIRLARGG